MTWPSEMHCWKCEAPLEYFVNVDDFGKDEYIPEHAIETCNGWMCRVCDEEEG